MKLLLSPLMKSLDRMSTLGFTIQTPHGLSTFRAKLVNGVFDLPAKASVLNAKQFNGKYGCSVCLHPGELIGRSRVYKPDTEYVNRTHHSVMVAAESAQMRGEAVDGKSPLSDVLNVVDSIHVDYMHAILEGVTRQLLKYCFVSSYHSEPYYIGTKLAAIDTLLLRQQPPSELSRPPRSLTKHMKYLKASELRSWLLFYSLPLLISHLPSLYLHHFALLVCGTHILLQDSITEAQVDAAEEMIRDFCSLLPELYGDLSCTANAHMLLHLPRYVRLWGPLWTHSAFSYESKNGQLKHLFHGRSAIVHQLMFNIDVSQTLQLVHHKLPQHESERTMRFLDSSSHLMPRSNMSFIDVHTYNVHTPACSRSPHE